MDKEQEKAYISIKKTLVLGFIRHLNYIKPDDKMCVSNIEFVDIENAFTEKDWCRLKLYLEKFAPKN